MNSRLAKPKQFFNYLSAFDRVSLSAIALLTLLLGVILWRGEQTPLRVTRFSWQGEKIGVQDQAFTLSFNQPVDQKSVENHLIIEPPLLGKMSWQGNRLVYSLADTPLYGTNYQIKLEQATGPDLQRKMEPFVSLFSTHDRALVYVGVSGEERGRLILYDITDPKQPKKTILTAKDLLVRQFQIYPGGDKILFSAQDPSQPDGTLQLFTVTTGIRLSLASPEVRPGKLERVLDNQDYANLAFKLSANGQTLIVLRSNRQNPADSGLWMVPITTSTVSTSPPSTARPLGVQGDNFVVSPNGKYVAVAQQRGVSLVPLTADAGPSQFLEGFDKAIAFSKNSQQLLLTQNNADYTRSLILREADGTVEEISRGIYPILDCKFEPKQEKILYCLRTDLVKREDGNLHEEPFLSAINLETWQDRPLLALPNYRDVQMTVSPDGVALSFDQVATTVAMSSRDLLTPSRQAITDARIWLLMLTDNRSVPTAIMPKEITAGFSPQWMP
jgi:dipeptidyl aminopeptidase/acylaminoacyl peptidase